MKIVIPSYNRAGNIVTLQWLPDAIICCCESQAREYKQHHKHLLVIPDERDGDCVKKKNAVLDYADDDVFLVDDDIKGIRRLRGDFLSPGESLAFIENGFVMMEDLGAGYWGVNSTNDPMKCNEYQPFSLTKPFYQAVGIKKDALRYDKRISGDEEVDFFLTKIAQYRKVLRFNLYSQVEIKHMRGGIPHSMDQRKAQELIDYKILMKKWGHDILAFEHRDGDYVLPKITVPIKGV